MIPELPNANSPINSPITIHKKFFFALPFLFLSPLIPDTRKYAVRINPNQPKNIAKKKPPVCMSVKPIAYYYIGNF